MFTEEEIKRKEELKHNKTVFLEMDPNDQELMRKIGIKNFQRCWSYGWDTHFDSNFIQMFTYRVHPDYDLEEEAEPEFLDYPIVYHEGYGYYGAKNVCTTLNTVTHLHCLPSIPGFRGFYRKLPGPPYWQETASDAVVKFIEEHYSEVIARFANPNYKEHP